MGTVFDINDSRAVARAIANENGLKVLEDNNATQPVVSGTTIIVPPPSIYNQQDYMQELHSAINQASEANRFFNVEGKDEREQGLINILRDMHCDKHQHGLYRGRDDQLRQKYEQREVPFDMIEQEDPQIASLLALGDDLRSQWQSSSLKPKSKATSDRATTMEGKIGQQWMSLETEEDIRNLLKMLEEEQDEQQQQEDDGESTEGEGSDSEGSEGGSPDGGSEGDSESEGSSEGDEEEGEGGDSGSEDSGQQEGDTPAQCDTQGDSEELSDDLKDVLGDIAKDYGTQAPDADFERPPYTPVREYRVVDSTKGEFPIEHHYRDTAERLLGDFSLSKRVRKYLLTLIQTRMQTGLRKGKLAPNKISRLYSNNYENGSQPRMFKRKDNSVVNTDIAISVLIDHSGSMRSSSKYCIASACGVAISEVLSAIDIAHNINTFSVERGYPNRPSQHIVKNFNERFVARDTLMNRFHRQDSNLYTCNADGESVMWAMERLIARPEKDKLLIVLSDGSPAYHEGIGSSSQYLKDVVSEIENAKGVDVLGIGILSNAVSRYYSRYKVLKDVNQLEGVLLELIKDKVIR